MNIQLLRVSLRQQAVYLPNPVMADAASADAVALSCELLQMGYALDEPLLRALSSLDSTELAELGDVVSDVMGTRLNWAALVRGWQVPTGESAADHLVTLVANMLRGQMPIEGTTLPCGHLIPDGTFPLERYTGCPFCGRPFVTVPGFTYKGQGSRLRVLRLWNDADIDAHFAAMLSSPVPLDATQRESLSILLEYRPLPGTAIAMKETLMLVIDQLVQLKRDDDAGRLFASPHDVLRYLWYRHTGHLQLIEPRTLLNTYAKNVRHHHPLFDNRYEKPDVNECHEQLRLKYDRVWCLRVARWLNALTMPLESQLEAMHPKRGMWVRFIRALRLTEYARRPGFEHLQQLLDRFYRQDYTVWAAQLDRTRRDGQADETLHMLKQHPGLFARCLFSTMLRLQPAPVLEAFQQILDQVPPRLLLTLGYQAQLYFDPQQQRVARPLSGLVKSIPPHRLLAAYSAHDLRQMAQSVTDLFLMAMRRKFAEENKTEGTVYIDSRLYDIPVGIGDRTQTVSDTGCALQGTRFTIEGDHVRLFLQWGKGLPAAPIDMDLSAYLLKDSDDEPAVCSYFSLSVPGACHSGDIRQIPDHVGTAEYVELSLPELWQSGVRQVVFTCNAYTRGSLSPNLLVGWMDAREPMTVSNETGVAYDPSTVSQMVRISQDNLAKGLVFGVLDVGSRVITWLEMPFDGQTVVQVNTRTVNDYLRRLRSKPTIGQLLQMKAEVQQLPMTDTVGEADNAYTYEWAMDAARVNDLLFA